MRLAVHACNRTEGVGEGRDGRGWASREGKGACEHSAEGKDDAQHGCEVSVMQMRLGIDSRHVLHESMIHAQQKSGILIGQRNNTKERPLHFALPCLAAGGRAGAAAGVSGGAVVGTKGCGGAGARTTPLRSCTPSNMPLLRSSCKDSSSVEPVMTAVVRIVICWSIQINSRI